MSTHNTCFCGEIRKILYGYPLLSVAMVKTICGGHDCSTEDVLQEGIMGWVMDKNQYPKCSKISNTLFHTFFA